MCEESMVLREHTERVQLGLKIGFLLFICSEASLFLALFVSALYVSTNPSEAIGDVWPPIGIKPFSLTGIPLLNSFLLVTSGFLLTASHSFYLANRFTESLIYLGGTIFLALSFTFCQYIEYQNSMFTLADSVYGSFFFFLTGFHGVHVIVGTIFLTVAVFFEIERACVAVVSLGYYRKRSFTFFKLITCAMLTNVLLKFHLETKPPTRFIAGYAAGWIGAVALTLLGLGQDILDQFKFGAPAQDDVACIDLIVRASKDGLILSYSPFIEGSNIFDCPCQTVYPSRWVYTVTPD